ncbi:MAG: hypothetical protein A2087_14640 [Spirochaetes bacterium GWD1_61_31]|nr:MAG: hypothetical protein A2Y37_09310 [Spirochaetes bacterium GWB1_60_80]OHD31615.1 MAG: hypothetical protein A2004_09525 [Spirochaetes bacterium GWC1_61_12]OHD35013.1 MAG: hypothetical protein A2087_14640 [Spirochaetes bacterium GWD1_61_31]OHD44039.1 MAG: hypothetical protein A2Y35_01740 [Spirochaetes bacterium GWE1_60_18]OHD59074.1 MAG: hypothetical protein A2Y32_02460 [Spirochaetes bacterium GWF1_60_12]HAP42605.1 hypothetical protein [Spirochaetaceae bacterium]
MTETALVTKIEEKRASVRFIMGEGCHGCSSKEGCASGTGRELQAEIQAGLSIKVGDKVCVEVPNSAHLLGLFWLIVLPVVLFGGAYLLVQRLTSGSGEGPAALAGIGGLAAGLLLAVFASRRGRLNARPRVIARLD